MDYSIIIPLGGRSTWDEDKVFDQELRYTLRSIAKNCDFDYDITIYSDRKLDWVKGCNVKITPRFYPEDLMRRAGWTKPHYEQFYDTLNKIRLASKDTDLSENIIYAYDDTLLVKKQNKSEIKTVYSGGMYKDRPVYWDNPLSNKWRNTISKAIKKGRGYGEVYLYETHLPRYFKQSNLQEMFKTFPLEKLDIPYAPATLYFNMFYNKPDVYFMKSKEATDNDIKAGFYGQANNLCDSFQSTTKEQIEKAVGEKIWVNYNDGGLTDPLKDWIKKKFPKKCKFEV